MLNSLNDPTRWRNHSRATKRGARTWKRKAVCSNGVPWRPRIRKRTRPPQERFESWAASTPAGFRFAVKMSGRITHGGRLELTRTFCERVTALGDKLGPVLVQLAPTRPRDDGFLRLVLDSLDPALTYAF